ncbi:MAG: hypothetical protein ACE5JJ_11090 [Nitrospinota bacterium]
MLYRVRGRLREERREEFFRILIDGTVREQQPDGREIVASMRRAVLRDGWAQWTETCYCPTPLEHERATVYDRFFEEIEAEPIEDPGDPQGPSFWRYLEGGSGG